MKAYPVLSDNGDGGYTVWLYASAEEREKEHPGCTKEDDPYETGYLSEPIDINTALPISMHFGQ